MDVDRTGTASMESQVRKHGRDRVSRTVLAILVALCESTTAGAADPVQRHYGDWTYTDFRDETGVSAYTFAMPDRAVGNLGVDCERGLLAINVINVPLIMTGKPWIAEISYDGGPAERLVNGDSLPLAHLYQLAGGAVAHVRWTFDEGTVDVDFSLRGATAALGPVAEACRVPFPTPVAAVEPVPIRSVAVTEAPPAPAVIDDRDGPTIAKETLSGAIPAIRTECFHPLNALDASFQGSWMVSFFVSPDGTPSDVAVVARGTTPDKNAFDACVGAMVGALAFPATGNEFAVAKVVAFGP